MQKLSPTHAFVFFSAILLLVLLGLSLATYWRQTSTYRDDVIAEHIRVLADIFKKIDEQCGIIGFEHPKNYIDFLTVESFVGSEVGSMNLRYPQHWQGPYLDDNPTIQEKYYEIISTHKGYFIVPGSGVELTNGKVIGKDIIFTQDSDIEEFIKMGILKNNEKLLAAKVPTSGH